MTPYRRTVIPLVAAFAAIAFFAFSALAVPTPYQAIVDRNPFSLKPVPIQTAETNQAEASPPVKVILTGITSMFGPSSKRAFLEIIEQQQPAVGKGTPAATPAGPKRPMLGEGDREGDVEVVSIDIEKNIVVIRNAGATSELTFEVQKSSPSTPAPNMAANSVPAAAAPAASQPIIIGSSESRGGITMSGGGTSFQGNTAGVTSFGGSTPMAAGNSGGISSYGGISPTGYGPSAGNPALASIPSRTIRTPTTGNQNPPMDIASQEVIIEASRIHFEQEAKRKANPFGPLPLPPTMLSREMGLPPVPGR